MTDEDGVCWTVDSTPRKGLERVANSRRSAPERAAKISRRPQTLMPPRLSASQPAPQQGAVIAIPALQTAPQRLRITRLLRSTCRTTTRTSPHSHLAPRSLFPAPSHATHRRHFAIATRRRLVVVPHGKRDAFRRSHAAGIRVGPHCRRVGATRHLVGAAARVPQLHPFVVALGQGLFSILALAAFREESE